MRVIAGKWKGHRIQPVPNQKTRPTTDKVKESLFQMIGPFFEGGICLDLFAGSGGLAIEALSRGIDRAILVDKHPKAISTIHKNIELLHTKELTEVYRNDAFRALKAVNKRDILFDIVFLDPPYHKVSYLKLLKEISKFSILKDSGIVVCEHDTNNMLPDEIGTFQVFKKENYGQTTSMTIYQIKGGRRK
ncbi:16S rRNA (guanine(966)-N(2))-methyltransferase RsmD [Gracilibacillus sp. YIM 98692]|uniref:16S rRNA (guanine(966)-N(2))-methyltransferase RsmD n=1 Tax=Gracilibacillus sp. YIM 98692 TaxID=2663532 RepID=UPI0013D6372A|nr:16S rRNA (guanine(966)-N(2))-methyltransferase RsmD [Gracilibacillus sp. YIM 98692]